MQVTDERCGSFCFRQHGLHVHGHVTGGCRDGEVAVVNLHDDWTRADELAAAGVLRREPALTRASLGHVSYYLRNART